MPKIVAKRLEKLQRGFLWGGGSLERKVHLINWEVVCAQKGEGWLKENYPSEQGLAGKMGLEICY